MQQEPSQVDSKLQWTASVVIFNLASQTALRNQAHQADAAAGHCELAGSQCSNTSCQ